MEAYSRSIHIVNIAKFPESLRGRKAHQFECGDDCIYFNSSGVPLNVADDSIYTGFSDHVYDNWVYKYYYNEIQTDAMAALDGYSDKESSYKTEWTKEKDGVIEITNTFYGWLFREFYGCEAGYSLGELTNNKWYKLIDAY